MIHPLVRFAYYRLENLSDAEDLVYDAVLRLLEKDISTINPDAIRLYLFRIVHNLCVDQSRSRSPATMSVDNIEISDNEDLDLDIEDLDRINGYLDRLPSREADIIRMNVIDGLSFVEISNILSIPASTAKSRYKSGMDKLRKQLSNHQMS